jgi:hypothetical protein
MLRLTRGSGDNVGRPVPLLSQTAGRWWSGGKQGAGVRVKHLAEGRSGTRAKEGEGERGVVWWKGCIILT